MHGALQFFHHLIVVWFGWVQYGNYPAIIGLMAMESSIIPVPSEIVIPPAAFMIGQAGVSFWGIVLAGTLGSYLGATVTYWVSRWVGRAVIVQFGKYFFVGEKKLEMAELWMRRYEAGGVFFARLLPVIRHLISIPAGIVRMGFGVFSAVTIAGSFAWCYVLARVGEYAHSKEPNLMDPNHPEKLISFVKGQSHTIVLIAAVLAVLYFLVLKLSAKQEVQGR